MNWYMIKTKDTYVIKLCIFFIFLHFLNLLKRLLVAFWLVNTTLIWMSPFCFESSCARDGGMWWFQRKREPYLVVGVRGIFLPWVILRRERRHNRIWISNFLVMSVPGRVGLCPYMTYERGIPIYGDAATPRVFGVTKKPHSLLLM